MSSDRIEEFLLNLSSIARDLPRLSVQCLIDLVYDAWIEDRTIFLCGNGGSAATASHFAADLVKFTRHERARSLRALSLCDAMPLISALANDFGTSSLYVEQLKAHFRKGDVLIAISVHGGSGSDKAGPWSQNLIAAARYVHEHGGRVASLTGFGGGALAPLSDVSVIVPPSSSGHLSTPLVESVHVAIHHLICSELKERIATATAGNRI